MTSEDDSAVMPHGPLARLRQLKRVRAAELFDAWVFAETDSSLALAAWRSAPREHKRDAYAAYVAALDREAHAARLLAVRLAGAGG